jgi:hypothetical protein
VLHSSWKSFYEPFFLKTWPWHDISILSHENDVWNMTSIWRQYNNHPISNSCRSCCSIEHILSLTHTILAHLICYFPIKIIIYLLQLMVIFILIGCCNILVRVCIYSLMSTRCTIHERHYYEGLQYEECVYGYNSSALYRGVGNSQLRYTLDSGYYIRYGIFGILERF